MANTLLKSIVSDFISSIKNNKDEDAINTMYDNLDVLKKEIKDYGISIKDKDILNIKSWGLDNCSKTNNSLDCFRLGVLELIQRYNKLELKEKNEVGNVRSNITYVVAIADDLIKIKLFILYLLVYYLECRFRRYILDKSEKDLNNKPHVGIDYEFNQQIIALMQINFEGYSDKSLETKSYIWIVNPGEFDSTQNKILIKYLMTNQDIYKIFQGSESLDIPYMYKVMFENNKDVIKAFTRKIIDTKYLCEYFKLSTESDKKCKIYEGLKYFGTISTAKYDDLVKTEDSMGPKQDQSWSIHKMSSFHVKYGLYDVLYLQHYLLDIYDKITKETPQLLPSYKFVNPITRFIYLERNEITRIIEDAKEVINPINNYLVKYKGKNSTLINVFNNIMHNFRIPLDKDKYIDFDFLLIVGYFRKSLAVILKKIIYYLMREHFNIYKNKTSVMSTTERIDLDITYSDLEKNGYIQILRLFKLFQDEAEKKILIIYSN